MTERERITNQLNDSINSTEKNSRLGSNEVDLQRDLQRAYLYLDPRQYLRHQALIPSYLLPASEAKVCGLDYSALFVHHYRLFGGRSCDGTTVELACILAGKLYVDTVILQ